jgi:hypothetical protein
VITSAEPGVGQMRDLALLRISPASQERVPATERVPALVGRDSVAQGRSRISAREYVSLTPQRLGERFLAELVLLRAFLDRFGEPVLRGRLLATTGASPKSPAFHPW